MSDITKMSALELSGKIKNNELSVIEVVNEQLKVIKKREPIYNSYITVMEDEARELAKLVQERIDSGDLIDSPLAGVPVAIKDNICTKGIKTTAASKMLADFVPSYDATVIEKLKNAGAVLIGKANLDEFAMGGNTETSYFGITKNPWNVNHTPGGSSGGSAAAVAAYEAFVSLGSDTGGSIRQPAAYCGLVGFKPTYGTVSRYGLIPYAPSLDQIGPLSRNVADAVALLEVISGYDPKDSTSVKQERYLYSQALIDDIKGMRIGVPNLYLNKNLEADVHKNFLEAIKIFEDKGAHIEFFDMKELEYSPQVYYVIAYAEGCSNLSRYDGVKYGYRAQEYENLEDLYKKSRSQAFGYEVKRRIMLGTYVLSSDKYETYFNKARKIRRIISQAYEEAFKKYDILISPTSPNTAPLLNSNSDSSDILNTSVNLAGLTAACIPSGRDRRGLPIGLQIIGNKFDENKIIRAAYSFEKTKPYEGPQNLD